MSSKKAAKKLKKNKKRTGDPIVFYDAARLGDCGAMGKMIDGGMDVNTLMDTGKTDRRGQPFRTTALYVAVADRQGAAVQLLLDRGADPNLAASDGVTPLMAAAAIDSL
eukprot:COSAG04_NODE_15141_length_542_cov_0.896163_1_plen_108_part_01